MLQRIALFFYARGLFRLGCFFRGYHSGMKSLGRCIVCGKIGVKPSIYAAPVTSQYVRLPETNAERNQRIRMEARQYGL